MGFWFNDSRYFVELTENPQSCALCVLVFWGFCVWELWMCCLGGSLENPKPYALNRARSSSLLWFLRLGFRGSASPGCLLLSTDAHTEPALGLGIRV